MLTPVKNLLKDKGRIVCLIKPQFEAGREKVGKKGVVRDRQVHCEVIRMVMEYADSIELYPLGLDFSPVKGPEGNIEYLLYLTKDKNEFEALGSKISIDIEDVVNKSHETLDKGVQDE